MLFDLEASSRVDPAEHNRYQSGRGGISSRRIVTDIHLDQSIAHVHKTTSHPNEAFAAWVERMLFFR